MTRYFAYLSYRGTAYHGWQRQPNGLSVQQVLEDALSLMLRQTIAITAAGRTDAGVHASLMVAHFDTEDSIPDVASLIGRLNNYLPKDIAISKIVPVQQDAHARFDATSREYEYRTIDYKSPFLEGLVTRLPKGLDYSLMNEAAQTLLGRHDFASFCKVHTDVKTTFCTVTRAEWTERDSMHIFTIRADRFLRNMVRAVVGTLLEVGKHRIDIEQFKQIVAEQNRCAAGESAPAAGLYLTDITYPNNLFV